MSFLNLYNKAKKNINTQKINQSEIVLFWFSRSNLLNAQIILDNKKITNENIVEKIYINAQKNIKFFMNLGLEIIFINPSNRFVTSQDFKFEIDFFLISSTVKISDSTWVG